MVGLLWLVDSNIVVTVVPVDLVSIIIIIVATDRNTIYSMWDVGKTLKEPVNWVLQACNSHVLVEFFQDLVCFIAPVNP